MVKFVIITVYLLGIIIDLIKLVQKIKMTWEYSYNENIPFTLVDLIHLLNTVRPGARKIVRFITTLVITRCVCLLQVVIGFSLILPTLFYIYTGRRIPYFKNIFLRFLITNPTANLYVILVRIKNIRYPEKKEIFTIILNVFYIIYWGFSRWVINNAVIVFKVVENIRENEKQINKKFKMPDILEILHKNFFSKTYNNLSRSYPNKWK